ncbi:MAG: TGS domain-containing protein, partial [Candidatus Electryonea clarkiae]|nr:TGS domain-containing protein [Candidatus Electryonea clarkiae]
IAEVGIAAHWRYKEGKSSRIIREDNLKDYYRWLRQVIEGSKEEDSSEEFMQTLKINLFTDEIYVFTPKGKLIRLPKESSPVDFAFAVHSDVGLKTLGSKVNGKMVPLNTRLFNGDSVEILTSANAHPSADWLRFVNSSKARSKIKRYFKQTQFEDSIRIGEELLQRELKANKLKMSRKEILDLVNGAGHESPESFYAAVGAGDLSVKRVLKDVIGEVTQTIEKRNAARQSLMRTLKRDTSNVRVKGADNLMIAFGNCCSPLPGDRIIGYLSKGRGIVVHRNDCPNIADLSKDPEKLVDVDWDVHGGSLFNCRLRIYGEDRNNLLKDMADVFSKMKVSVVELNLRSEGSLAVGTLVVQVKGLGQLSRLMNRVSKIQNIVKVERINVADVAEKIV